jgi:hypothetical protein
MMLLEKVLPGMRDKETWKQRDEHALPSVESVLNEPLFSSRKDSSTRAKDIQ